jgi:electron transport complex protein RnfC
MTSPGSYNPQPPRPAWGIRPPARKIESTQLPILTAPIPDQVVIPIRQCLGMTASAIVRPGQRVRTGEPIAQTASPTEQGAGPKLHASISGEVIAIEERPVPGPEPTSETCIVISSDGQDERYTDYRDLGDPMQLEPEKIRDLVAEAGIVGLGGALFSTAAKLRTDKKIRALILNGAECEPYITCDEMLELESAEKVLRGTRIMLRALNAPVAIIAVESDMAEDRVALNDAIEAAGDGNIHVSVVTAKYPAGGERQLIQMIMGQEVPEGGYPGDIGYVCHNVATAAAVADFFDRGRPLISRIVTLAGGGVETTRNVEARIGTRMSDLIESTVGYRIENTLLVMGGPMMGFLLPSHDLPVTKATNCLIVAEPGELSPPRPELPCIRCGECSEVCPATLLPQELLTAAKRKDMAALDELALNACIDCGCCDYVCPSHIPMTQRFIADKHDLRQHHITMATAGRARMRFENREARLEKEDQARDRDLKDQVDQLAESTSGAIDKLMARIRSKQKDR